jgi:PPOX class probable F420-dependent enzyme
MEIGTIITPGAENGLQVGERRAAASLTDLPDTHKELLSGPITVVMSTVNASGTVQLTPVWVTDDGDHLLLNTVRGRLKDRNLRARPQVSLLFLNPENPFHWLSIQGTVVDIIDEDDEERGQLATDNINAASSLYMGVDEYPVRDPRGEVRSLYFVRPDKCMAMGEP